MSPFRSPGCPGGPPSTHDSCRCPTSPQLTAPEPPGKQKLGRQGWVVAFPRRRVDAGAEPVKLGGMLNLRSVWPEPPHVRAVRLPTDRTLGRFSFGNRLQWRPSWGPRPGRRNWLGRPLSAPLRRRNPPPPAPPPAP